MLTYVWANAWTASRSDPQLRPYVRNMRWGSCALKSSLSGPAAMLGGVLGIVLTPILTYLWATYSDAYEYFGRAYFVVYLGCLSGLVGLYARRRAGREALTASEPDAEKWVFVLTLIGLVLSLVGDILEYWGGTPGEDFTMLQMQGYSVEGLGLLLVLCGSVAFGLIYRRTNVMPSSCPGC
jgi:hypothetical protein